MAPFWYVNKLTAARTKWKSANHGLESCNDEAGITKRSRGECMKEQY